MLDPGYKAVGRLQAALGDAEWSVVGIGDNGRFFLGAFPGDEEHGWKLAGTITTSSSSPELCCSPLATGAPRTSLSTLTSGRFVLLHAAFVTDLRSA